MAKRCFQCNGPFGLTRNYHRCHAFCTQKCLAAYKVYKEGQKPPDQYELPLDKPPDPHAWDVV